MAPPSYRLVYTERVQRTFDACMKLLEKSGRPRGDFEIAMDLLVGRFDQSLEPGDNEPLLTSTYLYTILDILIILHVDEQLRELKITGIEPADRLARLVA